MFDLAEFLHWLAGLTTTLKGCVIKPSVFSLLVKCVKHYTTKNHSKHFVSQNCHTVISLTRKKIFRSPSCFLATYLTRGIRRAGAYPSWCRARGSAQPRQIRLHHRETQRKTDNRTFAHLHLQLIYNHQQVGSFSEPTPPQYNHGKQYTAVLLCAQWKQFTHQVLQCMVATNQPLAYCYHGVYRNTESHHDEVHTMRMRR